MAWIKRNKFFVISVAVGLLLTGYCGYLLYSTLNANASASDEYATALSNYQAVQQKNPFPSTENIQAAKEDQANVRKFLADFRKRFEPFPAPPVEDERGFKTYLEESLVQFRAEATNAGVQVPADYAFSFSGLIGKLNYPPGNIEPWMQQLEEISNILNIVYSAKINYLVGLQRTPVSPDDSGTGDLLTTAVVTNQWGIVAPYKITFRGFSAEIAAVMEGFARSSNCFIIKAIDVQPDTSVPQQQQPTPQTPIPQMTAPRAPVIRYQSTPLGSPGRERGLPGLPGTRGEFPAPVAAAPVVQSAAPAAFAPPVTILSERPLLITVLVDVVKLKASEH